ncbi:hypothetical protein EC549_02380 [Helicobacter pylori]|nr:hypothetical protein EC549_02380 [Helicobacter pylori]
MAIGVNNKIQERLGQKPLFNNTQEFWELMNNGGKIEIQRRKHAITIYFSRSSHSGSRIRSQKRD